MSPAPEIAGAGAGRRTRQAEILDSRRSRRLAQRDQSPSRRATQAGAPAPLEVDAAVQAPSASTPSASTGSPASTAGPASSVSSVPASVPRTRAEAKAAARSASGTKAPVTDSIRARRAQDGQPLPALTPPAAPAARSARAGTAPGGTRSASQGTVHLDLTGDEPATVVLPVVPAQLATRSGRRAAQGLLSADITHPSTDEDPAIIRGRRAAAPSGVRRRAEVTFGRAVSNRRAWGAALAITLVMVVPGASMLSKPPLVVADEGMLSDGNVQATDDVPSTDPTSLLPTDTASATATAAARAKATATATATAAATARAATATARRTTAEASRSRTSASGPLAGINGRLSGLPYASGLYMPGSSPANASAFADWRGRAVDVVVDWPARQNWDDIENPDWLIRAWKGTPYTKVWGVAPIPEDGSSSLSSCAAGNNNSHWRTFAQNLKDSGYSDQIVIRLGWEFNGDWYAWSAKNSSDFAGCWRQIVSTVSAIAPSLRWDWNVNRGPGSSVKDAADAYPGDQYVDIVGIDNYDQYPGVKSEADWQTQYSGPYGLKHWVDFAKAHGKPFSVPEWGLYPTRGSNGGGDNPLYISKMVSFFKSNQANLAYEAYFNESADYYQGAIFRPSLNPKAAAEYKSALG